MDRRAFIAAGVTLLAGCGQGDDPAPSPTETTDPSTPTAAATATSTETDVPTETDTPTETATPTPDPRDRLLEEAAGLLAESVDAYVENGQPLGDLTDASVDVRVSEADVRSPLHEARDAFDELAELELSSAQNERLSQLRGAHWFLWWLPSTHDAVRQAFRTATDVWRDVKDRDWYSARNSVDSIEDRVSTANDEKAKIGEDSDPSDVNGFERLSPADYEAKLDQFERELGDAAELGSTLEGVVDAFELYESGWDTYDSYDPHYEDAANDFLDARRGFRDAVERLEDDDWSSAYGSVVDEALCVGEAMSEGCDYLDFAARAGAEDNTDRRVSYEEDAEEAFAECDLLAEEFGIGG